MDHHVPSRSRIVFSPRLGFVAGLGIGLLVGVGMLLGSLVRRLPHLPADYHHELEIPIEATASLRNEMMAVATGPIDDRVEGLFTLDFLTGQLQCAVLYTHGPRQNTFGAVFQSNVVADLDIESTKKPNYLLITGYAQLVRGRGTAGSLQPASCVAYVVDGNTGNFAAYGLPWNSNQVSRGATQATPLRLLDTGTARMAAIRE